MDQMGHNLSWFGHGANNAKAVGSIPEELDSRSLWAPSSSEYL